MEWSGQQSAVLKAIARWVTGGRSTPQVFRLFGYAGVGKSTIAHQIEGMVRSVMYAAYTGKAALVMRHKGCADASTLHSIIYKCEDDGSGHPIFVRRPREECALTTAGVLVVDEVSMVDEELGQDVLSYGCKVLVLGDPFQLPPPKDGVSFFMGQKPDAMLTEIHRQARDNPIIQMSMDVREGRALELGRYGDSQVITRDRVGQRLIAEADQVLCGLNKSRRLFNQKMRKMQGFEGELPEIGDKLICLRNDKTKGLLNGSLWRVKDVESGLTVQALVEPDPSDGSDLDVEILPNFFRGTESELEWYTRREYDEFDYGGTITVHKGQGSQWPNVVLFDESRSFREHQARHLYTGITRAAERITVVV